MQCLDSGVKACSRCMAPLQYDDITQFKVNHILLRMVADLQSQDVLQRYRLQPQSVQYNTGTGSWLGSGGYATVYRGALHMLGPPTYSCMHKL